MIPDAIRTHDVTLTRTHDVALTRTHDVTQWRCVVHCIGVKFNSSCWWHSCACINRIGLLPNPSQIKQNSRKCALSPQFYHTCIIRCAMGRDRLIKSDSDLAGTAVSQCQCTRTLSSLQCNSCVMFWFIPRAELRVWPSLQQHVSTVPTVVAFA